MADIIVGLIVTGIIGYAVFHMYRSKKRGGVCSCCRDSSTCNGHCELKDKSK